MDSSLAAASGSSSTSVPPSDADVTSLVVLSGPASMAAFPPPLSSALSESLTGQQHGSGRGVPHKMIVMT